ncbi:MAG: type II secretion system protein [Planctomycetota bacterium]
MSRLIRTIPGVASAMMLAGALTGMIFGVTPLRAGETPAIPPSPTPPSDTIVVTVDDIGDFMKGLERFAIGNGLDSPAMQEFLKAPKAEWNAILDRFAAKFGFSPRALSKLLSGRLVFVVRGKAGLIGSAPKDPALADKALAEFERLFQKVPFGPGLRRDGEFRLDFGDKSGEGGLLLGGKGRVAFALGEKWADAESLARAFLAGSLDGKIPLRDMPPEMTGRGIVYYQDTGALAAGEEPTAAKAVKALGIPGLSTPAMQRLYFENDALWIMNWSPLPEKKGLSALILEGPVSDKTLGWLPADCNAAGAVRFNPGGLIPEITKSFIASGDPDLAMGVPGVMMQVNMMLGMDLQGDFLAHLGDEIAWGHLPSAKAGGFPLLSAIGLNGFYAAVALKDATKFQAGLDKLLTLAGPLAAQDTVGGGVFTTAIAGTNVKYIKAFMGVIAPCFAVKDGYLIITTNLPAMKYILEGRDSWKTLATDEDFQKTLAAAGGKPGMPFSYARYEAPSGGSSGGAVLTSVAAIAILAGLALPAFARAREGAQSARGMADVRNLAMALCVHEANESQYPATLGALVTAGVLDAAFAERAKAEGTVYHYIPPAKGAAEEATIPLVHCRSKGKKEILVAYLDGHVARVAEETPEYRKILELKSVPWPAGVVEKNETAPAGNELNPETMEEFLVTEARNLAKTVDFAKFPAGEVFATAGSSNIAVMDVRKDGILTKSRMGHVFGGSIQGLMVTVAVVSIIAAIAIPNLLRSRLAANESAVIGNLSTLRSAEQMFQSAALTDADNNGTGEYAGFSQMTSANPPLIDNALGSGVKAGYAFTITTTGITNTDEAIWWAEAHPIQHGSTGNRCFYVDESGVIRGTDNGGAACTSRKEGQGWPASN